MKTLSVTISALFLLLSSELLQAQDNAGNAFADQPVPVYSDADIRMRLRNIASCVLPRFTDVVKSYVRTYTVLNRQKTERMLGKMVMYFPIYEKYAKEYGLPDALKYLSVTESALDPVAISSAKAVGLWQFMKLTGKEYGLRIDEAVDERCDPHLSTDAAMRYLQRQYKRFGNWALAIAAYNSGGGSVSRAIRRGRSKNFWKIRKYLPKETRNYVPAYIAAAYLLQNYEKHNLNPVYPDMDLQLTESIRVYDELSFRQIEAMTGISLSTIRLLNPSYKQDYIPQNQKGNFLILPQRVMGSVKDYFRRPDSRSINRTPFRKKIEEQPRYTKSYYTVQNGDKLPYLAELFNCSPLHLKIWNNLKLDHLIPGQELLLFTPANKDHRVLVNEGLNSEYNRTIQPLEPIAMEEIYSENASLFHQKNEIVASIPGEFLYHTIRRNESLKDIASKYEVSITFLMEVNEIELHKLPRPGNRIKVQIIK